MKFDLMEIERSKSDIRRNIAFPEFLTEDLAEFIGIMVGDGHLHFSVGKQLSGGPLIRSDICISFNQKEQSYINFVNNLFYSLFNLKMKYQVEKRSMAAILRAHSKGLVQFLNKICEIPLNKKSDHVKIPTIIRSSDKKVKVAFLRGLADTDFSISFRYRQGKGHIYPTIKAGFKSKNLVEDLENLFADIGFKYCVYYNEKRYDKRFDPVIMHNIYLNGSKNLDKWISIIGFSNEKFKLKIRKWQTDGCCPPGWLKASGEI